MIFNSRNCIKGVQHGAQGHSDLRVRRGKRSKAAIFVVFVLCTTSRFALETTILRRRAKCSQQLCSEHFVLRRGAESCKTQARRLFIGLPPSRLRTVRSRVRVQARVAIREDSRPAGRLTAAHVPCQGSHTFPDRSGLRRQRARHVRSTEARRAIPHVFKRKVKRDLDARMKGKVRFRSSVH